MNNTWLGVIYDFDTKEVIDFYIQPPEGKYWINVDRQTIMYYLVG